MDEESKARKMLAKAEAILASVDESFIITGQTSDHVVRRMPTFRPEEISLGPILGRGGFGVVHEIAKFTLDDDEENDNNNNKNDGAGGDTTLPLEAPTSADYQGETNEHTDLLDAGSPAAASDTTIRSTTTSNGENGERQKDDSAMRRSSRPPPPGPTSSDDQNPDPSSEDIDNMHVHYDVEMARHYMEKRCLRHGTTARYALKILHGDLSPVERARGMIDLAVEAKYLSVVWHPNISTFFLLRRYNTTRFFIMMMFCCCWLFYHQQSVRRTLDKSQTFSLSCGTFVVDDLQQSNCGAWPRATCARRVFSSCWIGCTAPWTVV